MIKRILLMIIFTASIILTGCGNNHFSGSGVSNEISIFCVDFCNGYNMTYEPSNSCADKYSFSCSCQSKKIIKEEVEK